MSKSEEQRDQIFEIKNCKKFNVEIIKMLKDFVAKFMQHIQHNLQFSIVIWHESKWQNFIIITLNAQYK